MAKKILFVMTSADALPKKPDHKTGWYLPEAAHPYDEFKKAGFEVTFASPKGGKPPLDPSSVEMFKKDDSSVRFKDDPVWTNTAKVSSFHGKASEYDALFVPGGHGPMIDLVDDADTQKLAREFAEQGKIVSAVCHGPAALLKVTLSDGTPLLKGKTVTGFSNAEEDSVDLSKYMPFMLETELGKVSGGKYVKADEPWGVKVVTDGNVITGQNPASAKGIGEAIIKALSR